MLNRFVLNFLLLCLSASCISCLCSCNDDDDFSSNSNDKLTFELDTVGFDTVITTVGSSTKRFKVYNKNEKGIRVKTIQLASGGESGFRINVDGHSGALLNDIEILKKDSIFIFAEVTLNEQNTNTPVCVEDELIFHLENGLTQKIILEAYGQDAIILHAPVIKTNTVWDSDKPYIIYDSLIVEEKAVLTLPEHTTLCFHKDAYMGVHGRLICNGSLDNPVIFRGDRFDKIFSYLPYDRMDAQWGGITLYPESQNNIFDYVDIHGGNYGIYCPVSTADDYKFLIQNSRIHNVAGPCIKSYYCLGQILNSQITNSGDNCVELTGGSYNVVHTTIAQFYPWNGDHGVALKFSNFENDTIYPIEQAYFYNCLITGNTTDEIVGNRIDNKEAAFNVLFDKCLVNIKMTGTEGDDIKKMFETSVNETGDTRNWPKNTDGTYDDGIVWGAKNFKKIDNDYFDYNFELTENSKARSIGNGEYVKYCPFDLHGIQRPYEKPDAGCYQYMDLEH